MARGIPVILDSIQFEKMGSASDFFKEMLNRYIPGEQVTDEC